MPLLALECANNVALASYLTDLFAIVVLVVVVCVARFGTASLLDATSVREWLYTDNVGIGDASAP